MKLTEEQAREFAYEGIEGYTHIETIEDLEDLYKDSCPATTVCQKDDDGTYWALDWSSYKSHYGCGEDEFYSNELYQVERKEKTVITKYWEKV